MIVLLCLDEKNGMMFHNRRQSQDRGLRSYIREMTLGANVFMNHYTKKLYQEFPDAMVR